MLPYESFGTIPDFWQQLTYPLDWLGDTITTAPIRLQKGIIYQSSYLPKNTLLFPNPEATLKQFDLIVYDLNSDILDPYRPTFRAGIFLYRDEQSYIFKPHSGSTEHTTFNKEEIRTLMKVTIIQEPSNNLFRPVPFIPESDLPELLENNPNYQTYTLHFPITDRKEQESREPVHIEKGTKIVFDPSRLPENKDFVIQQFIKNPKEVTIGRISFSVGENYEIDREAEENFQPQEYLERLISSSHLAPIVCFVAGKMPLFSDSYELNSPYLLKSGKEIPEGATLKFAPDDEPLEGDLAAIVYRIDSERGLKENKLGYILEENDSTYLIEYPKYRERILKKNIESIYRIASYTIEEPVY